MKERATSDPSLSGLRQWIPGVQMETFAAKHAAKIRGMLSCFDRMLFWVDDLARAQGLADGFASLDWVRVLGRYARQINPLLRGLLAPMQYYWVTSQSPWSERRPFAYTTGTRWKPPSA